MIFSPVMLVMYSRLYLLLKTYLSSMIIVSLLLVWIYFLNIESDISLYSWAKDATEKIESKVDVLKTSQLWCIYSDNVTIDILMYHYIREDDWDPVGWVVYGNSIPYDRFTSQIQMLAWLEDSWQIATTTMYELGEMLEEDCFTHEYLVVLTADDGRWDNYAFMPEVLEYFGIPMVLSIPLDLLPSQGRQWPFMNHEELAELLDSWVFELQSHSLTHSVMSAISDERQIEEICGSKWQLEDQFRRPINTFIYPWGKYNNDVLRVVEECGYRFGLTTEAGTNTVSDLQKIPFRLKRTRITRGLDLEKYFLEWTLEAG